MKDDFNVQGAAELLNNFLYKPFTPERYGVWDILVILIKFVLYLYERSEDNGKG